MAAKKFSFVRTADVDYNCTLLGFGHVLIQAGAGPEIKSGDTKFISSKGRECELFEMGAAHIAMPVSARTRLNELPDDALTKVFFYYSDPRDPLIKRLAE